MTNEEIIAEFQNKLSDVLFQDWWLYEHTVVIDPGVIMEAFLSALDKARAEGELNIITKGGDYKRVVEMTRQSALAEKQEQVRKLKARLIDEYHLERSFIDKHVDEFFKDCVEK